MNKETDNVTTEHHGIQSEEVFLDDDLGTKLSGFKIFTTFLIVMMAASGFFLLAWYAYQQSTAKPTDNTALETLKSDNSPTKVKPEEPGGMIVPNMDKTIYDHMSGNTDSLPKVERLLPNPEEPVERQAIEGTDTPAPIVSKEEPAAEKHAAADKPAPAEKPLAKEPVAAKPIAIVPESSTSLKPVSDNDLKLVPESKTRKQAPVKEASESGVKVQLASVKSEKDAVATWDKMKKKHPDLLGDLDYFVVRKDLGSKGVFYRLQAGRISGESNARLLCKKLTDIGQGCLVVK